MILHFFDLTSDNKNGELKTGDATLIIFPSGKRMLIDTGIPETAPLLVQKLKSKGTERIDYLVITHPHHDHVGGVPFLLDSLPVEKVYAMPLDYFQETLTPALPPCKEAFLQHGISPIPLWDGSMLSFGEVECRVLNPPMDFPHTRDDYNAYIERNHLIAPYSPYTQPSAMLLNDASITLSFTYGKSSFLAAGDLYYTGEAGVLRRHAKDLHCTLAKVNHHAAYTSNSTAWIKALGAKAAIGFRDSNPPVPAPELLPYWRFYVPEEPYAAYPEAGTDFYLTHWNGDIVASLDKEGTIQIETERGNANMHPSDRGQE